MPPLPTTSLKKFTYKKIRKATNKFNAANKIGEDTYKGTLRRRRAPNPNPDRRHEPKKTVRVVVRNLGRRGLLLADLPKCLSEIKKLETLSHPNLVPLLGYCAEPDGRRRHRAHCFLVFDLVENGSARDRLVAPDPPRHKPVAWERRMKIALQAGRALEHLHERGVTYRAFRSSAVLLDAGLDVRLAYSVFPKLNAYKTASELAAEASPDAAEMLLARAPELHTSYSTTKENDVWGFGTFLCETLMGKPLLPSGRDDGGGRDEERGVLGALMERFSDRRRLEENMDPRLRSYYDAATVLKIVTIAGMCFQKRPEARPSMKQINKLLDKICDDESNKVEYRDGDFLYFDH
ncbi:unnamed protein product [Cuscuta campestris]|uniref:Protein kinase domain-containing protein n=1 Tax=Cuscuta campestris TaxID=132261 RepID=A0A484KWZ3_9ASTE|nr:unnamed protein product [Cuscuta campestris]